MSGIRTESNQMVLQANGVDACFAKNTGVLAAGAPGVSGNDCAVVSQILGVGQTWQNLTGSRAIGTTYTNNTGKPIMVSVSANTSVAASLTLSRIVNGTAIGFSTTSLTTVGSSCDAGTWIVPDGATYACNIFAGTPSLQRWSELR